MAVIWRRKKQSAEQVGPAVVSDVSALTAASAPVPPHRWGKVTKTAVGGDRADWQAEAWNLLDLVGELSFAMLWKTALLSRFRLVASDLDPETGKPTGKTENKAAQQIVSRIAGGATGQSQMLGRLAPLMMIPGEAWLAIIYPDGEEQWLILSKDEIKSRGDDIEIIREDGTKYVLVEETDSISRIWRPDPRCSWLAWSPVKAALPVLRRMVRMEQNIEGAGKSRQAGNGILLLPSEVSMPTAPPPTGATDPDAPNLPPPAPASQFVTAGQIREALQQAMSTAISDPSSAEAMVPIILQVAGQWVDKVRHIKFDSEVSEKSQAALEAGTKRLAITLDMPPEALLGMADLNHWSLRGVEEEGIRWHAAPEMEIICDAFTRELMQPLINDPTVVVWYDTADVDAEPDHTEKVRQGFLDGVATAEAYARELGLGEDDQYDLTTKEGWAAWVTDRVRNDATLFPILRPLLEAFVTNMPTLPAPAPAAVPAGPAGTPIELEPGRAEPETREAAAMAVRMCVNEALRLAGTRRRSRADHDRLRNVPPREFHLAAHLGPCRDGEVQRLIQGWEDVVDDDVLRGARMDRTQLRAAVTAACRTALTTGTRPRLPVGWR
ncbi:hypothetical protein [Nocardia carnea]|uniref:hypothetical protein n=1 Tax=Nocardia carnea TaxID=37328 RepID=UPI002453E67B|nr:hypothetical protein [Nocardia carnea]